MSAVARKLVLVKHAKPAVDPELPSHEWGLSEEGRGQCAALAERLRAFSPGKVFTSEEPKAWETAKLVAETLGVEWEARPGLEEHDRSNVPQMRTPDFISAMAHFFKNPNQLVLGRETATGCLRRMGEAIAAIVAEEPERNIAIVTHGTVLALFLAEKNKEDPFQLWRRMQLPSFAVLSLPDFRLAEVVERL